MRRVTFLLLSATKFSAGSALWAVLPGHAQHRPTADLGASPVAGETAAPCLSGGEPEPPDDLRHDVGRRSAGGNHQDRFRILWHFQGGKLTVEQLRGEEMPGPALQAVRVLIVAYLQENHPRGRPPGQQRGPVGRSAEHTSALQSREKYV